MTPRKIIARSLCAVSLAAASAFPFTGSVRAEGTPACVVLLPSSIAKAVTPHQDQLRVVKTQKLYRTEQRPYAIVPQGAAIWVQAPRGTTLADLHQQLVQCQKQTGIEGTPLCVPGARISVDREHGLYVVNVKSDLRSTAIEIQRRAERL